jgi:hypothetical protein
MNKVFGINICIFYITILVILLYYTKGVRDEGFFVSPDVFDQMVSTETFDNSGALTQLESTHVISKKRT